MSHDLAAVLAAYMAENRRNAANEAWSNVLGSLADCVGRHQGRVIDVAVEGWFIAEFSNALEAVRCAVEIQRELADRNEYVLATDPPRLRMGLNHEVPPKEGEAWPPNADNSVDRLVALAEPGGICMARTIYDDIRSQIDLPFDTTRDPKHTAFLCQEIRRKFNDLNLLELAAVRLGAKALAGHAGKTASTAAALENSTGLIGKIKAYLDRYVIHTDGATRRS